MNDYIEALGMKFSSDTGADSFAGSSDKADFGLLAFVSSFAHLFLVLPNPLPG